MLLIFSQLYLLKKILVASSFSELSELAHPVFKNLLIYLYLKELSYDAW